jgi:outer membrane protein TolC
MKTSPKLFYSPFLLWISLLFISSPIDLLSAQENPLPPADLQVLELSDFLTLVESYHPVAKRARLQSAKSEAQLRQARGGFDPKIFSDAAQKSFDGKNYFTTTESGVKVPTWLGLELKGTFQTANGVFLNPENSLPTEGQANLGARISLLQGMFFDQRRADLRQAQLLQELNEVERNHLLNDLWLDAYYAYWHWALAYREVRIYEQSVRLARIRLDGIRESFLQGDNPAVDTLETMIQYQNRQVDLIQALTEFQNWTWQVEVFLWDENERPLSIPEDWVPIALDQQQVMIPPREAIASLRDNLAATQPDLRRYAIKQSQLEIDQRLAREMLKPRLDVEYNFLSQGVDFRPASTENALDDIFLQNYKWGIHFSFPLFLRKERGKLQLNQIKLQENRLLQDQKQQEWMAKLSVAENEAQNIYQQINLYTSVVANYQRLLDVELVKFELGESSIFLLNSRENKLIEAQLKLASLRNKFQTSRAKLFWTGGRLPFLD